MAEQKDKGEQKLREELIEKILTVKVPVQLRGLRKKGGVPGLVPLKIPGSLEERIKFFDQNYKVKFDGEKIIVVGKDAKITLVNSRDGKAIAAMPLTLTEFLEQYSKIDFTVKIVAEPFKIIEPPPVRKQAIRTPAKEPLTKVQPQNQNKTQVAKNVRVKIPWDKILEGKMDELKTLRRKNDNPTAILMKCKEVLKILQEGRGSLQPDNIRKGYIEIFTILKENKNAGYKGNKAIKDAKQNDETYIKEGSVLQAAANITEIDLDVNSIEDRRKKALASFGKNVEIALDAIIALNAVDTRQRVNAVDAPKKESKEQGEAEIESDLKTNIERIKTIAKLVTHINAEYFFEIGSWKKSNAAKSKDADLEQVRSNAEILFDRILDNVKQNPKLRKYIEHTDFQEALIFLQKQNVRISEELRSGPSKSLESTTPITPPKGTPF